MIVGLGFFECVFEMLIVRTVDTADSVGYVPPPQKKFLSYPTETLTPLAPPRGRGFRVQSLWCTGPPCSLLCFFGGKRADLSTLTIW